MNIRSIIEQLVPRHCLLCGGSTGAHNLCSGCAADLPVSPVDACPHCARPGTGGAVCGVCLKRPPAFDATLAAFAYRFPLDQLIPQLKYHGRLAIAPVLGELLASAAAGRPRPDRIIPMPLHPARLAGRGFNHATEIARRLCAVSGLVLDTRSATRVRDTPPQQALSLSARRGNVRGAFICAPLAGLNVALLDDVMTTGTSLDELARAVKRAGAARVECWVVARTPPPGG